MRAPSFLFWPLIPIARNAEHRCLRRANPVAAGAQNCTIRAIICVDLLKNCVCLTATYVFGGKILRYRNLVCGRRAARMGRILRLRKDP